MKQLAINGGRPVLKKPLKSYYPSKMGWKEKLAVLRVVHSRRLSEFVAGNNEYFLGGKEIKRFEKLFCEKFKVKHAVSFNSATTALHGALVALKIGPGDEVIVPPYTMSATATAVVMNGAVPVFADITDTDYCLDPKSVEQKITKNTKAIIVVNLFGGPVQFKEILAIAKKNSIKVIEDNAQAASGLYQDQLTGTIGDIGVFSLNIHKSINSGEGGVLVTNNDTYALRAQLARNHGEVVADQMPELQDKVIMGSNYRLTELQAAVAYEQLLRLDVLTKVRIDLANYLSSKISGIEGLIFPDVHSGDKHVFYVYPIRVIEEKLGMSRDQLADAMTAEGFSMSKGYVKPIYWLPIFQNKKVFNETNFPFVSNYYDGQVNYDKGICPVCERMYEKELTLTSVCQYPNTKLEVDLFVTALKKVLANKDEIK